MQNCESKIQIFRMAVDKIDTALKIMFHGVTAHVPTGYFKVEEVLAFELRCLDAAVEAVLKRLAVVNRMTHIGEDLEFEGNS